MSRVQALETESYNSMAEVNMCQVNFLEDELCPTNCVKDKIESNMKLKRNELQQKSCRIKNISTHFVLTQFGFRRSLGLMLFFVANSSPFPNLTFNYGFFFSRVFHQGFTQKKQQQEKVHQLKTHRGEDFLSKLRTEISGLSGYNNCLR